MSEATFYTHVGDAVAFTLRLTRRALAAGDRVLIWAVDEEALSQLDYDFWASPPEGFLPHQSWNRSQPYPQDERLVLAAGQLPARFSEPVTVLNLSPALWSEVVDLNSRVLEIVSADLDDLAEARNRFRAYRQQGFDIVHHNMSGKA